MTTRRERSTRSLPWALDPHEAERWLEVARRRGAVFLDYDGTLTPIVSRPEQATLSESMRSTLERLAECLTVSIVSGRDVDVVAGLVGIDTLSYVGSHGLDITGPPGSGWWKQVAPEFLDVLGEVEDQLRQRAGAIPGVVVERKRFSVSTHVRLVAPQSRSDVDAAVDRVHREHPMLRREGGKMVFELRPDVPWDKGRAVSWLLEKMGRDRSETLFIGDDLTDETVFRELGGRGTGIVVAETARPTGADLRLDNVDEVQTLLEQLTAAT